MEIDTNSHKGKQNQSNLRYFCGENGLSAELLGKLLSERGKGGYSLISECFRLGTKETPSSLMSVLCCLFIAPRHVPGLYSFSCQRISTLRAPQRAHCHPSVHHIPPHCVQFIINTYVRTLSPTLLLHVPRLPEDLQHEVQPEEACGLKTLAADEVSV